MNCPFFSIIVPIYNVEKYLHKCIDSILAQSFCDYEVILVDDGSPDNCSVICDKYKENNLNIKVIHQNNKGLVRARQEGALLAKGKYVICIDADDWIDENYLKYAKEIIDAFSPDVVCFGHYVVEKENCYMRMLGQREGYYDKTDIRGEIFPCLLENENAKGFTPTVWAKVFKKELYIKSQNEVDESVKIGEDGLCVKPCIYYADSIYIDARCVYYYRYNPTSITKDRKASKWEEPRVRAENLMRRIDMHQMDFQHQLYRSVVHSLFNVAVSQFNRKEKYSVIAKDISKHLDEPFYREAIHHCYYKNIKGKLAVFILKKKLVIIMKIYNRIK